MMYDEFRTTGKSSKECEGFKYIIEKKGYLAGRYPFFLYFKDKIVYTILQILDEVIMWKAISKLLWIGTRGISCSTE